MKILTVINPEATRHVIIYSDVCNDDIFDAVETAFEELDIHCEPEDVVEATECLEAGKCSWWWKDKLCFDVIEVAD